MTSTCLYAFLIFLVAGLAESAVLRAVHERGTGSTPIGITDPAMLISGGPGEKIRVVDSDVLPVGGKIYKLERSYRDIPMWQSGLVVTEDPDETELRYWVTQDDLNGSTLAKYAAPLFNGPLPEKNLSTNLCMVNWKIDATSKPLYISELRRYIHVYQIDSSPDDPDSEKIQVAIILDDVKLWNKADGQISYRCMFDASNQTMWQATSNTIAGTPPAVTPSGSSKPYPFKFVPQFPSQLKKNSSLYPKVFCMLSINDTFSIYDQRQTKNLLPVDGSPANAMCSPPNSASETWIQCLDYLNKTQGCLKEKLNIPVSRIIAGRSVKLFLNYGDNSDQASAFYNGLAINFASLSADSSDMPCGGYDFIAYNFGFALTANLSQMVYVDDSACLTKFFSEMTVLTVNQCLKDASKNEAVDPSSGTSGTDPAVRRPRASNTAAACPDISKAVMDRLVGNKGTYNIYSAYSFFFNVNRFYWNKYLTFSKAACNILQYARDIAATQDTVNRLVRALVQAGGISPDENCAASATTRPSIATATIATTTTASTTVPAGRGTRPPPSSRDVSQQAYQIYQLTNCVKLYGLAGNLNTLRYYKLRIATTQMNRATKLVIALRNTDDSASFVDMSLKYGSIPQSSGDIDIGNHFDDTSVQTITVSDPPNGDYYIILKPYGSYKGVSLGACYLTEQAKPNFQLTPTTKPTPYQHRPNSWQGP